MSRKVASLSLLSAAAASLCCIAPLLALFSGVSGVAANFSWMEPARPYLIGLSVCCLGFAWYRQLQTPAVDTCGCETQRNRSFLQSKKFLTLVTVFAGLLLAFPSYSHLFYRRPQPVAVTSSSANVPLAHVEFRVVGMGCADCEPEVEIAVGKLNGVRSVKASCVKKNTVVFFDSTQTSAAAIWQAINSTGYIVQNQIR